MCSLLNIMLNTSKCLSDHISSRTCYINIPTTSLLVSSAVGGLLQTINKEKTTDPVPETDFFYRFRA